MRPAIVAGESIAVDPAGKTYALWLDHREMASAPRSGEAHQHGPQASQLFFAPLDGSAAQSLTRGVCYCCRTALAASGGSVYAAWRHVYADNHRDIAFTMSRDDGRTFSAPVRVSDDNWAIDGCPENGPALALDRQRRVHIVWPTRVDEKGSESLALFHASKSDGKTFTQRSACLPGAARRIIHGSRLSRRRLSCRSMGRGCGRRATYPACPRGADRSGLVAFRPLEIGGPADGRYPAIATTPTHLVFGVDDTPVRTSAHRSSRVTLS
jgi:hypothetical protein